MKHKPGEFRKLQNLSPVSAYGPPQNAVSLRRMYVECMLNVCDIHTYIPSTYIQHTFNIHVPQA